MTVTAPVSARVPVTLSAPALMVIPLVKVLAAERVRIPVPSLVKLLVAPTSAVEKVTSRPFVSMLHAWPPVVLKRAE